MTLTAKMPAPFFTGVTDSNETLTLETLKGKNVVLYFYPKDSTSGCTIEACNFRDAFDAFQAANTEIVGVSKDSAASHAKFKQAQNLNFPLLVDNNTVCEDYGVWVEKSMYGKKYWGIERATFLIDGTGTVRQVWRKVSVAGHVAEVLKAAQAL